MLGTYFAADHDPRHCECKTGDCLPTVWVLDPVKLNEFNPRLDGIKPGVMTTTDKLAELWAPGVSDTTWAPSPIAIYGTHNSPRIVGSSQLRV